MKSHAFVSVVLVIDQPLAAHEAALHRVQCDLDAHYFDYEVVVIAQGPTMTHTLQDDAAFENIPSVRYIQLATRVHLDVAWAAALENAIGDFVVIFDPAADPLPAISETVKICMSGFDVVVGVASQSRTPAYRIFRSMADRILMAVDYCLPHNATGLRCLSRRAINSVTRTGRFHHQLAMRIQKSGYPQTAYNYTLLPTERVKGSSSLLSG